MRIVRTPDGQVVIDETGRVAGRGAYLCPDGTCWTQALAKGALQRALERSLLNGVPPQTVLKGANEELAKILQSP